MPNTPFSIRLNEDTKKRLKQAAKQMNRSEAYVANMAIENELYAWEQKRNAIDTALEQADKGHFISSQAIGAWVDSWGGDDELPPPEVDINNLK